MTLEEKQEVGFRNKQAGNRFEIKIANREKRNSLQSIHTAGPHSLFDIWSRKRNGEIWYISCKVNGYHSPTERVAIKMFKKTCKPYEKIKLAYYINKKRFAYKTL
jgi:hypothetical protein